MNTGMLWFDDDPRTGLSAKIVKAADYYLRKYGLPADLCLVNPAMLGAAPSVLETGPTSRVSIRPSRMVLPGHLWIGNDNMKS